MHTSVKSHKCVSFASSESKQTESARPRETEREMQMGCVSVKTDSRRTKDEKEETLDTLHRACKWPLRRDTKHH